MEFLDPHISEYVLKYTREESPVLKKLNRETWATVLHPRMLAGHLQGRVLSMLSHMIRPQYILEIGTYTGYSAICFAEGLVTGGEIHTIDINEELQEMVKSFFKEAQIDKFTYQYIGKALDILPKIEKTFDLVYIDADKENYCNYYDMVFDKVKPGGFIIADNVLWSGKVLEEPPSWDSSTRGVAEYNEKIHKDPRVENVLFPIRDGLMIAKKL